MSLTVRAVEVLERGGTVDIEGAPGKAAGFESWRTEVWAASAVISLAEAVRRPRPSRLILPSLARQDILVEGEELDQLEREVDALLAHTLEVVRKIRLTTPMVGGIVEGGTMAFGDVRAAQPGGWHTPSESEIVDVFRQRLLHIKEAVQLARTVPRGGVEIS
jgi:hypothetical protein